VIFLRPYFRTFFFETVFFLGVVFLGVFFLGVVCLEVVFFGAVFFFAALFLEAFFAVFLGGTFLPSLRASERPMAMACLRLFTVAPLRPLFSWPRFSSCIAFSTFFCAAFEYLAIR